MAQPGFIFGGNTGISYDELQQRRKVLDAMMARQSAPQNVGEGIFALTQGLVNGLEGRQLRQAEEEGRKTSADAFSQAMAAMNGRQADYGQMASASSVIDPVAAASNMPASSSPAGGALAASGTPPTSPDAEYVRSGLVARGLPEHVADAFVVNFKDESGLDPGVNERNPLVPGSRGGFGLYQLTGPRRTAYEGYAKSRGVDPSNVDAQLDFLVSELGVGGDKTVPGYGSESRAAQGILAAPNTATAAQRIVNDFLRPAPSHRAERAGRYASLGGSPVQVASNDPSAGVAAATAPQTPVQTVAAAMPQQQAQAPSAGVQRVAQAMPQMPAAPNNSIPQEALVALQNPYLSDGQRQALQIAIQQRQAGNNALYERQMAAYEQQVKAAQLQEQRAYDEQVRQQGFQREDQIRQEGYGREDNKTATAQANNDRDFAFRVEQGNKPPTSVQEYEYARAQGFQGTFAEYEQANRKASATNVTLPGQPNIGTIPPGFQAVRDENTGMWTMSEIPGGPADKAKALAAQEGNREISTSIVTTAAQRAREAVNAAGLPATGSVGGVLSALPESNAAELRRQVAVLQANAKIENLTAMRAASPTGAALGAVSDSENAMLAAKSGTLDPSSPNFARDLDDYERTLLRIVHGPKVGDVIYEQTRGGGEAGPAVAEQRTNIVPGSDAGQRYEGGVPVGGMSQAGMSAPAPVQIKTPEEFNALPAGALFVAPDGTTRRKPNG